MEKVKELKPKEILLEWWWEVKEKFWEEEVTPRLKEFLKLLMGETMREELEVYTQAEWHQRTQSRLDYRNGYYRRGLTTKFGQIEGIKISRLRHGKFQTKVFKRYQRYQEVVEDLIEGIYLRGVSTAKLAEVMLKIVDQRISTTKISNVVNGLDKKVKEYQRRELLDEYQYLIFDAITLKAKEAGKVRGRKVWEGFIWDLYNRGLKGEDLKLIVTDGHKGLRNTIELWYILMP